MVTNDRGRMLTVAQVAEKLNVSVPTVHRMIDDPNPDKRLKAYKLSDRVYRVAEVDLEEFFSRKLLGDAL